MKIIRFSASRGQSLLELVVALSIISVALVTLMTLSATTVTGVTKGRDLFLAYNYAREAMELVQHYRDSNFLLDDSFDECISPVNVSGKCPNREAIAGNAFIVDAYETDWSLYPAPVPTTCLDPPFQTICQLFIATDAANTGKVMHSRASTPPDLSPTKFYRMLEVVDVLDEVSSEKIGIKVEVKVSWQEENVRTISLVKEFYDWRALQ